MYAYTCILKFLFFLEKDFFLREDIVIDHTGEVEGTLRYMMDDFNSSYCDFLYILPWIRRT